MNSTEEFKVISDLEPSIRGVNIKVRCNSKIEEREVISKKTGETLRITEALVGDETGSILLTLWNDDIDKVEVEHVYQINNAYTTVFKGSLRLNTGKYGSIEEINEEGPAEVNIENNLSKIIYEQPRFRPKYGSGGQRRDFGRKPFRSNKNSDFNKGTRRRY